MVSSRSLIDLRSDTVTRPTPAMRRAMAEAEVGDDGYGEDPTVRRLEEAYAERVGKPAAVFVPSGTMANQISLRVLTRPGAMVLAGARQHIVAYERGAGPLNAGIQFQVLDDTEGILDPEAVRAAYRAATYHQPTPALVCIEQTHMAAGGRSWSVDQLVGLKEAAGDLPIHMDGARLFNAEVATGVPAAAMTAVSTTVTSCLSKGLGAPVGSVLAGPAELEPEMRLARKRLGGAMRQAGILAAAGLVALDEMVERLADDHRRARRLAEVVAEHWPEAGCAPDAVTTNVVLFRPPHPEKVLAHLRGEGVLAGTVAPGVVRLMTHHDVDDGAIELACQALASAP